MIFFSSSSKSFSRIFPGVLFCIFISVFAWILGRIYPIIGGSVFGIILGMLVNIGTSQFSKQDFNRLEIFKDGATYSGKKLLQLSVILLGFEMNIIQVFKVGSESLTIMFFTLLTAFVCAYIFGKLLKITFKTTILIGVGTAICGGSAIAAIAPIILAKDDEIAHAISTIFLFNILAVFIFPAIGHLLNMSNNGFGIWAGTAVNDTSSVLAVAYSYSDESGKLATIIKLTRTLMIVPIAFFLALYMSKSETSETSETSKTYTQTKNAFPLFVLGFLIIAIVNSANIFSSNIVNICILVGKFLIIVALVGIGLNTNLVKLMKNGIRPIALGLICWFSLASVSLFIQYLTNTL